jgi:ribosome biogenesis protein ENP2
MKVASANNVKVYTVSGQVVRALPDWLIRQKKRSLRDDPGTSPVSKADFVEFRNRIELIQDFEFPEASNRIKVSADGNYAVATGIS